MKHVGSTVGMCCVSFCWCFCDVLGYEYRGCCLYDVIIKFQNLIHFQKFPTNIGEHIVKTFQSKILGFAISSMLKQRTQNIRSSSSRIRIHAIPALGCTKFHESSQTMRSMILVEYKQPPEQMVTSKGIKRPKRPVCQYVTWWITIIIFIFAQSLFQYKKSAVKCCRYRGHVLTS